jgi:PD-(D/E)XK endonuclease
MVGLPPSVVGARSEMAVMSALQRSGHQVFVPICGAHSRTDLVIAQGDALLRLQVKTCRLGDGFLIFPACSHTANVSASYHGQVDAFGVYSPDLNLVYLVPVLDVPAKACHLRLEPARNNQKAKVRWAADYLVGPP